MNILLLTHGEFAKGIKNSLQMIVGVKDNVDYISINSDNTTSYVEDMINEKIDAFKNGKYTLIITDISGGSTTQTAIKILNNRKNVYLVSGLNLGLLLELSLTELTDDDNYNRKLISRIIEESKKSICLVNDLFNSQKNQIKEELGEL